MTRPDPYRKDPGTYAAAFLSFGGILAIFLIAALIEVIR